MKKAKTAPRNRRKNIESMKREEIIEELRKHLDPIAFQKNLTESTAMLRGLLCYQRDPLKNDERIFPKVGAKHIPVRCACGAPWGHTGKHFPQNLLDEIRNVEPIAKIESIRPTFRRNWYGKKILTGLEVVIHRRKG